MANTMGSGYGQKQGRLWKSDNVGGSGNPIYRAQWTDARGNNQMNSFEAANDSDAMRQAAQWGFQGNMGDSPGAAAIQTAGVQATPGATSPAAAPTAPPASTNRSGGEGAPNALTAPPAPNTPPNLSQNSGLLNQSSYEMRPGEDPRTWGQRAWGQGARQYLDPSMNPNTLENPQASSPFTQWFNNRFQQEAPQQAYMGALLNGGKTGAADLQSAVQQRLQGGWTPMSGDDAATNIHKLFQLGQQAASSAVGTNSQLDGVRELIKNPSQVASLIYSQLEDSYGGAAAASLGQRLQDAVSLWNAQPSESVKYGGNFLNFLTAKFGWS